MPKTLARTRTRECAECGYRDDEMYARHPVGDGYVCSPACEHLALARHATRPADVLLHVTHYLAEGGLLSVRLRVRLGGGGREYEGEVVDWRWDGAEVTIARADGREHRVAARSVRSVEVVDA